LQIFRTKSKTLSKEYGKLELNQKLIPKNCGKSKLNPETFPKDCGKSELYPETFPKDCGNSYRLGARTTSVCLTLRLNCLV
jgi:hypothetical protein